MFQNLWEKIWKISLIIVDNIMHKEISRNISVIIFSIGVHCLGWCHIISPVETMLPAHASIHTWKIVATRPPRPIFISQTGRRWDFEFGEIRCSFVGGSFFHMLIGGMKQ